MTILSVVSLLCCAGVIALDLSFPRSVKPTIVFLPSTSPAHGSVAVAFVAAGVDFYTTLSPHMVGKFVSFLSIGGRSSISLVVDVLLLSTSASLPSRRPSSSSSPLRNRRCPLHSPTSFLCFLVVKDVEGTSSSLELAAAVLDKIQHLIDADLPSIVRPPLLQPQPPQTPTPLPPLPLLRSSVTVPCRNPLLRQQVLEQQHQPPLFLLPSTTVVLRPQPLAAVIGAGAAASASFVSSSLCHSRASVATTAADGFNCNSNCFHCSLLCCCSFLSQQLPCPRSFAVPLPSVCPTSLLDHDRI
ncbi:hypothetical protein BHM03_00031314 [Ensete ventricosum]|nr:hypothetical protein BHM03_00031314 [Ensete ventricosum]